MSVVVVMAAVAAAAVAEVAVAVAAGVRRAVAELKNQTLSRQY